MYPSIQGHQASDYVEVTKHVKTAPNMAAAAIKKSFCD